jgi:pimeloyl-ACP methyl ester carboxylesterase
VKIVPALGRYDDDPPRVPPCDFAVPPDGVTRARTEGQLVDPLLAAARSDDPVDVLWRAAQLWVRGDRQRADAMADLVATAPVLGARLDRAEHARTIETALRARADEAPAAGLRRALRHVIHRARLARAYVLAPPDRRTALRAKLRRRGPGGSAWIGATGTDAERTLPHHPVNLSRTTREEARVRVRWKSTRAASGTFEVTLRTARSRRIGDRRRPVLLLIHGLGSRLEETEDLAAALSELGVESIAFDLPNHAHSGRIPFSALAVEMRKTGRSRRGPFHALDITAEAALALARTLLRDEPALRGRLCGVAGGSLGGTLALRIAQSPPPWMRLAIAWSPATAWQSFCEDPHLSKRLALEPGWTQWLGNRTPIVRVGEQEDARGKRRHDYIRSALFARVPWANVQLAKTWWRGDDYERARRVRVAGANALRREVYDEWLRRWCSALEHEQMCASLRGRSERHGHWPWDDIAVPVLLVVGAKDDVPQTRVASACRVLAERAVRRGTPLGRFVTFENTGHSIHDERPRMLAQNVAAFVRASSGMAA